jgi:hypothetical protein
MGVYIRHLCPNCKRQIAISGVPSLFSVGRPLVECGCGQLVNIRDTQNEWTLLAPTERIGFGIKWLLGGVLLGVLVTGLTLGGLETIHSDLSDSQIKAILAVGTLAIFCIYSMWELSEIAASKRRTSDPKYMHYLRKNLPERRTYWGGLLKEHYQGEPSKLFHIVDRYKAKGRPTSAIDRRAEDILNNAKSYFHTNTSAPTKRNDLPP